jgi:acetolactate synthase-1/2/3 large subunit
LIQALLSEGVTVAFGYPGGAILPLYDRLSDSPIRHILVRHEQGAAHMADGYARASGGVGVAIATSGPGSTNLVTALPLPILTLRPSAITGQSAHHQDGRLPGGGHRRITIPIISCEHIGGHHVYGAVKRAFIRRAAGPARFSSISPRTFWRKNRPSPAPGGGHRGFQPDPRGHGGQIKRAAKLLAQAVPGHRGGGVIRSGRPTSCSGSRFWAPVLTTLMGKSAVPQD